MGAPHPAQRAGTERGNSKVGSVVWPVTCVTIWKQFDHAIAGRKVRGREFIGRGEAHERGHHEREQNVGTHGAIAEPSAERQQPIWVTGHRCRI